MSRPFNLDDVRGVEITRLPRKLVNRSIKILAEPAPAFAGYGERLRPQRADPAQKCARGNLSDVSSRTR